MQVYSAQERFGLPSPGACSKDGSVRCEQWVLHVSDHASFEADPERPEVFMSETINSALLYSVQCCMNCLVLYRMLHRTKYLNNVRYVLPQSCVPYDL